MAEASSELAITRDRDDELVRITLKVALAHAFNLTDPEAAVLELLLRSPRVTRQSMALVLWGDAAEADRRPPNSLRYYVKMIRPRLDYLGVTIEARTGHLDWIIPDADKEKIEVVARSAALAIEAGETPRMRRAGRVAH